MAFRLLSRQNLRKLSASFSLLNRSQKTLLSPSLPSLRTDVISPGKYLSPLYPFGNSWGARWASYESVNLVLSDDGKPKFEIEEVEPSKKGRYQTKRRLKLQRKREKKKRKEANKNDPRRIRPKGKKIKQKFPTAEARLKYKIEKEPMEAYERFAEISSSPFKQRLPPQTAGVVHNFASYTGTVGYTGAAGEPLQIEKLIHSAVSSSFLH